MFGCIKKTKNKIKTNIQVHTAEFAALKEVVVNTDQLVEETKANYTYEDFIKEFSGELSEEEFVRQCMSNQKKILAIYVLACVFVLLVFAFTLHPIYLFLSLIFILKSLVYIHKIKQLKDKRLYPLKELIVNFFKTPKNQDK